MFIGEVIKDYRTKYKISQRTFASRTNLSPSYINTLEKIYNPKTKKPYSITTDAANELARAMNMSIEELLGLLDEQQEFEVNSVPNYKIPILNIIDINNIFSNDNIIDYINIRTQRKWNDPKNYFAFEPTEDNMLPLLGKGDLAIVHYQEDVESGQTALIFIADRNIITIKKIIKTENGLELHSMNPYFPIEKNNNIKILGRVIKSQSENAFN